MFFLSLLVYFRRGFFNCFVRYGGCEGCGGGTGVGGGRLRRSLVTREVLSCGLRGSLGSLVL